ncbi:MAG: MEDS domain-containing protein [Candidatus Bathyarchaeota archaeon]|nr:MEDS domain-containing protein [Candidatus Bathyarchaeota archaeon]
MLSLEKDAQMLSDFGLTHNQAKVYLAIVQLGIAPVGKISRMSKVRREDVYRILPKLEKMGLVEKILGTPIKIRAIPLDDALSILIKHEKDAADQKLSALMAKKDQLLKDFSKNKKKLKLEGDETHFALLSTRDVIINKGITALKEAEKEIDIVTSLDEFSHFLPTIFAEPIEKLMKKGGKVRVILELHEYNELLLKNIEDYLSPRAYPDIRFAYQSLSHYIIVDYGQVMMATSPEPPLGEHPYLWTDNRSFAGLTQENFEELWHSSMNSKAIQTDAIPNKVTDFVGTLKPTDHIIFLYQSEEAKHNVLFNYIKVGLENGDAGAYVASEESPSEIRDAMRQFGISVEKYEKTGALSILSYDDVYIIDGKFDIPTTIGLWSKLYDKAMAKGFKGLRVTGEMACFFEQNLLQELIDYERALHKVLDLPMIAICAYNSEDLSKTFNPINLYNELVKAHGTVLFAGMDNKLGKIELRKA